MGRRDELGNLETLAKDASRALGRDGHDTSRTPSSTFARRVPDHLIVTDKSPFVYSGVFGSTAGLCYAGDLRLKRGVSAIVSERVKRKIKNQKATKRKDHLMR